LEDFLDERFKLCQWVSSEGDFDQNPMLLEVVPSHEKTPKPFKLNLEWLKDEDFLNKIKKVWNPFYVSLDESNPIQFHQNLKRVNKDAINWFVS
jgi:hypothetical protein